MVRCTFLVVALAALASCERSDGHKTADYFGASVEPPRDLAKLRPGMTVAEARQLVPTLRPNTQSVRDELVLESGDDDITLGVQIDGGVIAKLFAIIKGHSAPEILTKSWGEPQISRDALGQHETTWASEKTEWKAKLDCFEANCHLDFLPYRSLTTDFFGSHVVPPGALAKLRIGMPVAEAKTIAPGPVDASNGIPTGIDGVRERVEVDDKLGVVRALYLNMPQFSERVIEEAWGPGEPSTGLDGKAMVVWLDPATRWRAQLRDALGSSHDLWFDNFVPAAQLLGDQPDRIDGLMEPVLGRTVEEIKAAYKADVSVQGRELTIALPPTEWESKATRVNLDVAGGRVKQLSFALPFKAHPAARESLLELFTHKWGEPSKISEDGKAILVFRDADPRVEAHEDTDRGAWRFELR